MLGVLHVITAWITTQEKRRGEIFTFLFKKFESDMKNIIKQVVGIDVAQKELVVCLGRMYSDWEPELYGHKTFSNTLKGFESLTAWVSKLTDEMYPIRYVLEATGVYHESLACFLDQKGQEVSILLPNKISNYVRTLAIKTVTDKTASEAIALFGLERKLECWQQPKAIYKKLQQLTRERDQLVIERTVLKNQLHAELAQAVPYKKSVERIKKRISLLERQENEILQELDTLIKTDQDLQALIILLCTIPGIGNLTAATVLAETNGFELIRNKRQLTSYAGLDVREKQSGTSVRGKARISKRGNRYLRKAMHMPALAAIRHNEGYKAIFSRLVSRHGIKMKAGVAIQRKLLELMYTLYKKRETFDKSYLAQLEVEEIIEGAH
jgi:transposase